MNAVTVVSSEPADAAWVRRAVAGALAVVERDEHARVVVVRSDRVEAIAERAHATTIVLAERAELAALDATAAHVITRAWPDAQLRALLTALAAGTPHEDAPVAQPVTADDARDVQRAIAAARRLATVTQLVVCEAMIADSLVELIDVERAHCLFHDHATGALWSQAKLEGPSGDDRRSVTGLAGYAARTGYVAIAPVAGEDPRFARPIDDPAGHPSDHVVAQPVVSADGTIHAVFVCARRAHRPMFSAAELALLGAYARLVSPILDQLAADAQSRAILDEAASAQGLFRVEAVQERELPRLGEVVRVSPAWLPWTYRLLVALLVGTGAFVIAGSVASYSTGPALVRSKARVPVIARTAGNVIAVEVAPGDHARPGTVVARLDDSDQRAEIDRLSRELEVQLRNHMRDPGDAAADAALRRARLDLEAARTALGERLVVASTAGVIGDIRVRVGQRIAPGDLVASLLDSSQGFEVIALLPGEDRPVLAPGMTIRLELAGYRYAYQSVAIDAVSPEVIAPAEARRVLGGEVADGIALGGPVVIVRGHLASTAFEIDGRSLRYHDGMLGRAEVRVREEPIVFALIPGLRRLR